MITLSIAQCNNGWIVTKFYPNKQEDQYIFENLEKLSAWIVSDLVAERINK